MAASHCIETVPVAHVNKLQLSVQVPGQTQSLARYLNDGQHCSRLVIMTDYIREADG